MIIKWPLNGLFHDPGDLILTSQTDVRKMEDNDKDNKLTLVGILRVLKTYWV